MKVHSSCYNHFVYWLLIAANPLYPGRYIVEEQSVVRIEDSKPVQPLPKGVVRSLQVSRQSSEYYTVDRGIMTLRFSPDGQTLACGDADGRVHLWDVKRGRVITELTAHSWAVTAMAIDPGGRLLATASKDRSLVLHSLGSGKVERTFRPAGAETEVLERVTRLRFSNDGKWLAAGNLRGGLKLCRVSDGKEVRRFEGMSRRVTGIEFSRDDSRIFASGANMDGMFGYETNRVMAWNTSTGEAIRRFRDPSSGVSDVDFQDGITSLSLSPDGRWVVACNRTSLFRWDSATGVALESGADARGPSGEAYQVVFSPSGKTLAVVRAKSVELWEVATWRRQALFTYTLDCVRSLVFSPDERFFATGTDDNRILLWDVSKGE